MRDAHAAQDHRIARTEGMHVVARGDADRAGGARRLVPQQLVSHAQILRRGELSVSLSAFDQRHIEAEPFGDAGIVGELAPDIARSCAMSGEDRIEAEALRRLRAPELIALDRSGDTALACAFQRVGDGEAGKGAVMRLEAGR